jgi:cytidylate kinase
MSIIAISRGTFQGGEDLAKRLAERLGYQCIGREVILQEAWEHGLPAGEFTAATEKAPWLWERLVGERVAYLTFVRAALCEYAREGNLIYHGHLGHLLLPGISHVIGVRLIADMEFRIKSVMQKQNLTRPEAITYIERRDKERLQWTRLLYDVDWDDPRLYDVVLNLSRMRLATACETVARMTEQEEFKPTAESVKAMQDLTLHSRVLAALVRDFRTRAADLSLTADDGIVTIKGTTQLPGVVELVPSVARQVEGVKEVRSEVTLVPSVPLVGR